MQIAKQVDGSVVIAELSYFYPNTSFEEGGPSPDFIEQEGIFFVDNNLSFDPTVQKLSTVAPYLDSGVARSVVVAPLTQAELHEMRVRKSGQVIDDYKATASRLLDQFAQSRGYDNIISVTTYVNSTNPDYVTEANRAIYLRDVWWTQLTTMMNEVLEGTRPLPATFDELASELPALTWDSQRSA